MIPRKIHVLALLVAVLPLLTGGCRSPKDHLTKVLAAASPTAAGGQVVSVQPGVGQSAIGVNPLTPEAEEPPPPLFVYVSGAVVHPGVYQLPSGARGCDALSAAGGGAKDARLDLVNLAALLSDGQQLHIPSRAETERVTGARSASGTTVGAEIRGPINVNRAVVPELMQLPGIGAVLAGRIIAYRTEHGPFTQVDDLLAVPGIGDSKLRDIKPFVTVGP